MQKFHFLLALTTLFLLFSCNQQNNSTEVITQMEETLLRSSKTINLSTAMVMKELEDKTVDVCTKERADIWYPKAEKIVNESGKIFAQIEKLKSKQEISDEDKVNLFANAIKYKETILSIHPEINDIFTNHFDFVNKAIDLLGGDTILVNKKKLDRISIKLIYPLLISLQNDIKINENKIVNFCNNKVGCMGLYFDLYSVILGQNSNYLKPGTELEINAGVGAFSKRSTPQIIINGKEIPLGEEGYSVYKIKTPKIPGKYKIPVKISFVNLTTGKNELFEKSVEYTVINPCNEN